MPLANASAEESSIASSNDDFSNSSPSSTPKDLPPEIDQEKLWTPPSLLSWITRRTLDGRNTSIRLLWKSWENSIARPLTTEEKNAIAQINSQAYWQSCFATPLGLAFAGWRLYRTRAGMNAPPFGRLRGGKGNISNYRPYWDGETLRLKGRDSLGPLPKVAKEPFVQLFRSLSYAAIGTVFISPLALLWAGYTYTAKELQDPRLAAMVRERWDKAKKDRDVRQHAQGMAALSTESGGEGQIKSTSLYGKYGGQQQGANDDASPTAGGEGSFGVFEEGKKGQDSFADPGPKEQEGSSGGGSDIWENIRQQSENGGETSVRKSRARKEKGKRKEKEEGEVKDFFDDSSDGEGR